MKQLQPKNNRSDCLHRNRPLVLVVWILFCVFCNCTGWVLSGLHLLNRTGYSIAFLLGAVALVLFWVKAGRPTPRYGRWRKLRRRFGRLFPFAFLTVAFLAFLGGLIHPPTNYDALAYRTPRVLSWLAEERWHWIQTLFTRLNTRSSGMEWISAPLFSFFRSDRPLFLVNTISFLLLPGLLYSLFTRLGVHRRVAWFWMWIAPTGYCFLLQAGSIGNDSFSALFVLAAVDFALRAWRSESSWDVAFSILAAALFTGTKLNTLPLLLPWAIALLRSTPVIVRNPFKLAAVCLIAAAASCLPTVALNIHHTGHWTGREAEPRERSAVFLVAVNSLMIPLQNLAPPLFPFERSWNDLVKRHMSESFRARLVHEMETGSDSFKLPEMQIEENAGLGFGVTALVVISACAGWIHRNSRRAVAATPDRFWLASVRYSPLISLLVAMTQLYLAAIGRLLTPYYLLLIPIVLTTPGQKWLVSRRLWRLSALGCFLIATGLLIASPPRPLFPVEPLLKQLRSDKDMHPLIRRAERVYLTYKRRPNAFAPAVAVLPKDLKVLGLVTWDDPEASLWKPFGSRRIERCYPGQTEQQMREQGIQYILASPEKVKIVFGCSFEEWLSRLNGEVVRKITLLLRASDGERDWYLIRLAAASNDSDSRPVREPSHL